VDQHSNNSGVSRAELAEFKVEMEREMGAALRVAKEASAVAQGLSEEVTMYKKEIERLKMTVNRLEQQKGGSGGGGGVEENTEQIVLLEEEIEVLDTRIDEEEGSRKALEAALMGLVSQLQQDLDEEREKVADMQEVIKAWSNE
jgi:uncharacterized small protein (DUF1192 family)